MPVALHAARVPANGRGRSAVDFAIAGGGLIGLATAWALHRSGARVAVFDRAPAAGAEASGAAGGILSALYPWEHPPGFDALARFSRRVWPTWCDSLGADTEYRCCGLVSFDVEATPAARTWADAHDEPFAELDETAARRLIPALAPGLGGALHFPGIATLNPRTTVAALAARLAEAGVELHWNTPVARIRVEAGRVQGLVLEDGNERSAGAVVVATGAWSRALLEPLGIGTDVQPVRGQIVELDGAPGLLPVMLVHGHRYLVPRVNGRILAGSTSEQAGFDKSVSGEAAAGLRAFAASLLPRAAELEQTGHWAGLRPGSSHGTPVIGPVTGLDGLWLNTGHFRNGITLGAGSAELFAALATGAEPPLDPAPFAPPHGG